MNTIKSILDISIDPPIYRTIPTPGITKNYGFSQVLIKSLTDKESIWRDYLELRDYPVMEAIIRTYSWDLFESHFQERIFNVEVRNGDGSLNDELTEYAQQLLRDYRIEDVLLEHIEYLIVLGELLLKIDWENREIDSPFPQTTWRAIYRRGELTEIYFSTPDEISPEDAFLIHINQKRIQIRDNEFGWSLLDNGIDYPASIIVGQGLLNSAVLNLIRTIVGLDGILSQATALNILNRHLVYLNLPPATPPERAWDLAMQWELNLNQPLSINTLDVLMELASRFRVVPILGEKSRLDFEEIPKTDVGNKELIDSLKIQLSSLLPLPPYQLGLIGIDESSMKSIIVRYYKTISKIRHAMSKQIEDFVYRAITREFGRVGDFDVVVKHARIPSIDALELADYSDSLAASIQSLAEAIQNATNLLENESIDKERLMRELESMFDVIKPGLVRFTDEDANENDEESTLEDVYDFDSMEKLKDTNDKETRKMG